MTRYGSPQGAQWFSADSELGVGTCKCGALAWLQQASTMPQSLQQTNTKGGFRLDGEHLMLQSALPPAILTACDREPIHILGAIQPFGFLLSVNAD